MLHFAELVECLYKDARIAGGSLFPLPWKNVESIVGSFDEADRSADSLSELAYIERRIRGDLGALRPGRLRESDGVWNAIKSLDQLRAQILPLPLFPDRPMSLRQHHKSSRPEEAWFFVNGIATDKPLLKLNGRYLSRLFERSFELIYNPTLGIARDLFECLTGRTFNFVSEPAAYALERVSEALANPEKERVILMGHSQGGIIVSNVVQGLIERFGGDAQTMGKLEVYTFASACDQMETDPILRRRGRLVPFIEHFANTDDLVARIGVLAKRLEISGRVFVLRKPGHLLNAHYLPGIEARDRYAWYNRRGKAHHDARLFAYLKGGTPAILPI